MQTLADSASPLLERLQAVRASVTPERQVEIDAAVAADRARDARRKVVAVGMPSIFERTPIDKAPPRARRWADAAVGGSPRNLVVMGNSGAGKTEVACALLADLALRAPCRFATFGDVLRSVRETYGGEGSERGALAAWTGCRILCLDDLGKERPTPDALDKLFALLDARYRGGRPTLFTTQYLSPSELGRRLMEGGGDKPTAQAIVRRVYGMGEYKAEVVRC